MNQLKTNLEKLFSRLEKKLIPLNTIEIDRQAIVNNFSYIQKQYPDKLILPVLKANAYGHGLAQITSILKPYTDTFMADSYFEALTIRKVCPKAKIILIGSINPQNLHLLDFRNVSLTLQDKPTLKVLLALAHPVSIHLKVNTGMNRQGINPANLTYYLKAIKNSHISLDGLYSHLSDADNPDDSYSQTQQQILLDCFKQVKTFGFNPKYIHLSATAGIPKIVNRQINTIRLGIGLYGYNPLESKDSHFLALKPLTPALSFYSSIIQIHHLKKGDQVSYNRTFTASKDMTVGTISAGYFEAIDRRLSNAGFVKYKNKFLPIIGRVCMNLTVVDFKTTKPKLFDKVQVISSNPKDKNSIQNIAKICQTIPYDILVHLNQTIHRKIV